MLFLTGADKQGSADRKNGGPRYRMSWVAHTIPFVYARPGG